MQTDGRKWKTNVRSRAERSTTAVLCAAETLVEEGGQMALLMEDETINFVNI